MSREQKRMKLLAFSIIVLLSSVQFLFARKPQDSQQRRPFDEYGDIRTNDEKARLDGFAVELKKDPRAQAYVIAYGGSRCPDASHAHGDFAKDWLVNMWGIDAASIIIIDGGRRSNYVNWGIELWIVRTGENPPTAIPTTPTLRPCPQSRPSHHHRRHGRHHR
jgi:hypothetical protein